MAPLNTVNDCRDVSCGNTEFVGKGSMSDLSLSSTPPYLQDIIGGELRVGSSDPRDRPGPSLRTHIPHIVGMGADEEMIGPDAGWIVTMVKHEQSCGNNPVVEFPREPMGLEVTLMRAIAENAVATSEGGSPDPTLPQVDADHRAVLINLLPETICRRSSFELHRAREATEFPRGTAVVREDSPTVSTGGLNMGLWDDWMTHSFRGRLLLHDEPPIRCATLPDGDSSRGLSDRQIIATVGR